MMRTLLRIAAVCAAAAVSACSAGAHTGSQSAAVGRLAPSWSEPTSSGAKISMDSLRGKPVYLNFFATWCPPCNEEAPDINALQKKYAKQGLQVVGVDELENAKKAESFVRKYALVYPAVVDDGTVGDPYAVNGLPVHVFITRSGVIKKIFTGEMSKAQIESDIRSIL